MGHRTQIYLDNSHYTYLRALSRKLNKSLASIIRDLIDEKQGADPAKNPKKIDPIFELRGLFSDEAAVGADFDDLLYGEAKR